MPSYLEDVAAAKTPAKRRALERRTKTGKQATQAVRQDRAVAHLNQATNGPSHAQVMAQHHDRLAQAHVDHAANIRAKLTPREVRASAKLDRAVGDTGKRGESQRKTRAFLAETDRHIAADKANVSALQHKKLEVGGVDFNVVARGAKVIGDTALATGAAFAHDPLKQAGFLAKGVKDTVRGLAGAPAAAYVAGSELARTGHTDVVKKFIHDTGKDYKRRYGGSYNNDAGALGKQIKRQRKEGSFAEVLDLSGVGKVGSAAAGAAVRQAAKHVATEGAGVAGRATRRIATATREGAVLRDAAGVRTKQGRHTGAVGAVTRIGKDAARAGVQRRAVKKAETGTPLAARRALKLAPDEVVPLSGRLANTRARKRVAQDARIARQRTSVRAGVELTGRKGPRDVAGASTLRQNFDKLPKELHTAVTVARQSGIRSSAAAREFLPKRIEQLKRERDAGVKRRTPDTHDNLPELEALLKNPDVFDNPEVHRVADIENARADRIAGGRQGFNPERKDAARNAPVNSTLGVSERIKGETQVEYGQRLADELNVHPARHEEPAAYRRRLNRALDEAHAGAAPRPALARAEGETTKSYTTRVASELKMERQAHETAPAFRKRLVAAADDARTPREAPAPRRKDETPEAHAARALDAQKASGLSAPGYVRSVYNTIDEAPTQRFGGTSAPVSSPIRGRNLDLYKRGAENLDPRVQEQGLLATIRRGEWNHAQNEILKREGTQYATLREAQEAAAKQKGVTVVPLERGRRGEVPPSGPAAGEWVPTDAHVVVPNYIAKEIKGQTGGSSSGGRALDKIQGLQNASLLAASLSWAQFQVLADASAGAAAGGLHRAFSNNKLYKAMSDADRENVDVLIAGTPANDTMLWEADRQAGALTHLMEKTPGYERFLRGNNPLTILLRLDAAKSNALRRSAVIQRLGVDAKTLEIDGAITAMQPLQRMLRTAMTKPDPAAVSKLLRERPDLAEKHAEHVMKIMGNFADYTHAERVALRRFIPFYGFLRYSTKMVFYTLPVDHPYMALLLANIGRLSANEAKDVVGEDLPYGLSRVYSKKNGKDYEFDLSRASPVLGQLLGIDKPQQAVGLLPPIANIVFNQVAGKNIYLNKDLSANGVRNPKSLTAGERERIALRGLFDIFAPGRQYMQAQAQEQGADSLPWDKRPIVNVDPKIAGAVQDEVKTGSTLSRFLTKTSPLTAGSQPSTARAQGQRATLTRNDNEKKHAADAARRTALRSDPVAKAVQASKIIAARANAQAKAAQDAALPPAVKTIIDKANAKLKAQGLPPIQP